MKASVEALSGVKKQIRVEIPAEEVDRRMEEGFAELRRVVPIRGFRRGKAPLSMVKRLFREAVEQDVAEGLVKDSLALAVRENNLRIVSPPEVEPPKIAAGRDFSFTATVEVVPEVEPRDYKGLPAVREKVDVAEAEVDAVLESLREEAAQFHPVEGRGAAAPDLAEISYTASVGGETIESVSQEAVLLGTGRPFGREFEEKLAGASPGEEREFEIAFPADAPKTKYAGKTVSFRVAVQALREKRLPPLDDEFAKGFEGVLDLSGLRSRVRERLLSAREKEAKTRLENEIREALLSGNAFEVPRVMVDKQVAAMIEEMTGRMALQGIDLKKVHLDFEKMRERFAPAAEKAVRAALLFEAIARKEGIEVPYSEMEAEMRRMAEAIGVSFEEVRERYGDEERLDALRDRLLEKKVMEFLVSHAAVREEQGGAA